MNSLEENVLLILNESWISLVNAHRQFKDYTLENLSSKDKLYCLFQNLECISSVNFHKNYLMITVYLDVNIMNSHRAFAGHPSSVIRRNRASSTPRLPLLNRSDSVAPFDDLCFDLLTVLFLIHNFPRKQYEYAFNVKH